MALHLSLTDIGFLQHIQTLHISICSLCSPCHTQCWTAGLVSSCEEQVDNSSRSFVLFVDSCILSCPALWKIQTKMFMQNIKGLRTCVGP